MFRVDVASGKVTRLTKDGHFGNVHALAGGGAIATMNSIFAPDDLYRVGEWQGHAADCRQQGASRPARSGDVATSSASPARTTTPSGAGSSSRRTRPASCRFPSSSTADRREAFHDSWSYRWNPRLFIAPGYAAVSVDFHGSTGYGQAFTDAIHQNWGGWPLEDLQKGLAYATAHDPQLDADNACALGGSYGGYMMNWIEGKWPDRFKCIVQHDGVFDARAMAYETEELWFDEWEHGGHPYYEAPAEYEKWNPVNYVQNWKTPQLVITSENDFRIPYTQGIAAFTALQRRGIPSRLLIFPDENHWVLKPKNSIQWYDEVFAWENRWLGQ